ncbi:Aminopeptidase 2 mitochondrial [Thoreauomyces humboldtii]|nr:Aminopeptidase 2 mitochondrial [Thoreauomyces humboldtii]
MCHLHNHTGPAGGAKGLNREVLPANVKPTHYRVEITPDLVKFEFKGIVDVHLNIVEKTSTIVCNANQLSVHKAVITSTHLKAESTQTATKITLDEKAETVTFEFDNALEAGATAVLHIEYSGIHNDKMTGFYRTGYKNAAGEKSYMVVTQFEATDCRRALPSWDEPNLKATFDVVLNIESKLTALSNMNQTNEKEVKVDGKALKAVSFATTPIMSTYLLAFVVGDLEYIETTSSPKAPADAKDLVVRVYTLPGQKEQGRFALEVCARILEYFSEYYDVAYPLPKMDLIAVPDFGAGAMENWGLVTYREIYLLFDEKSSSAAVKQQIAYVVGHELAHQWFGNLVTMDWWSELWLNEGFATFVGWMATDNLFPEWKIWTQFITDNYSDGKDLDALRSSHPIDVDVKSPSEILQIFDAISYCKGASVIRMLNTFLGQETFQKGIRAYLKKHQFTNATTHDLWNALSEASGQDVASFMQPWTRDVGYPLVTVVDEKFDEAKGELTLRLKQDRYLSSGDLTAEEELKGTVWWVPLVITTHLAPREATHHILSEKEASVTFPYSKAQGAFWKLNFDTTGFYRVRLSEEQLRSLGAVIKADPTALTTEDMLGVLGDAFALAFSGHGSTAAALELMKSFEAVDDYVVLDQLASNLNSVLAAWYREPKEVTDGLRAIKRQIFSPKAKALGLDQSTSEDHLTSLKRTLCIENAASAQDPEIVAQLTERFHRFVGGDDSALPPNIRKIAYVTVLKNTKDAKKDFEAVLNIYRNAPTPDQRVYALTALGAVNDKDLVHRILHEITFNTDIVRSNEATMVLSGLATYNPEPTVVRPQIWDYVVNNWKEIVEKYTGTMSLLGRIVTIAFTPQVGTDVLEKVESFVAGKDLTTDEERAKRTENLVAIKRPIDQGLEALRSKTAWVERERTSVAEWVRKSNA